MASSGAYAARGPRPRRRVARRVGPSRIRWDRVGRIMLTVVLFGVMISYLNPAINLWGAYQDKQATQSKLAELKSENVKLQARVAAADTPAVLEREARKFGMVRPGEHAYVIRGLPGH